MQDTSTQPTNRNLSSTALQSSREPKPSTHWKDVMKAIRNFAFTALALLLTFVSPAFAQQAPDNVEGNWTIYSTDVDGNPTPAKHIQVQQSGNQITGYFEGPYQSGPIVGEVTGHRIRFSTVTRNALNFGGEIYGNRMSGSYGIEGRHGTWQAVRPQPLSTMVQPAAPAADDSAPGAATAMLIPATFTQPSVPIVAPSASTNAVASSAPTPAPLSPEELDSLVAPIALYPDALVAQVLAAATNPDQLAAAQSFIAQNPNLTGSSLEQAVNAESWDPSVKALTEFPSVLNSLADNLSWTSTLGQAFDSQQADVMAAVQVMRAKAQAAGTLQSNSQITVTQPSSNTIMIQPASAQVVYVPQYNPAVVYGAPVTVPLYVAPPAAVVSAGLSFGAGVAVGAGVSGGGWGWNAWNMNWGGGWGGGSNIIFNNNTYINNRTWNNNNHGWIGPNGQWHADSGYRPGSDTNDGPGGHYHSNGYFGPNGAFHPYKPGTDPKDQPNGGNNGNHGLIGGNGGVEHPQTGPDGSTKKPANLSGASEHANGTVASTSHPGAETAHNNLPGAEQHSLGEDGNRNHFSDSNLGGAERRPEDQQHYHSPMSGHGNTARAEANRGHASMNAYHAHPQPVQHVARTPRAPQMHAPHGGGGRAHR
jgi:hypothetical protein